MIKLKKNYLLGLRYLFPLFMGFALTALIPCRGLTHALEDAILINPKIGIDDIQLKRSKARVTLLLNEIKMSDFYATYLNQTGFHIETFLNQMEEVKFEFASPNSPVQTGSCSKRRGMSNNAKAKTVTLSPYLQTLVMTTENFDLWIFHEILGALGVFDENYALSTTTFLFARLSDRLRLKALEMGLFENVTDPNQKTMCDVEKTKNLVDVIYHAGGGSTGVGAGGDPLGLSIKLKLLTTFLSNQLESDIPSTKLDQILLKKIILIPVEIKYGAKPYLVNGISYSAPPDFSLVLFNDSSSMNHPILLDWYFEITYRDNLGLPQNLKSLIGKLIETLKQSMGDSINKPYEN